MWASAISQFFVPTYTYSLQLSIISTSEDFSKLSTTILGEEGRMRLETVFISMCGDTIHAYNPSHLLLTAHPKDLREVAV